MGRAAVLVVLLAVAGCSTGPRVGDVAFERAKRIALEAWIDHGEDAPASGARVYDARRDGPCVAVQLVGPDGPPGNIAVMTEDPAADGSRYRGWTFLGFRDDTLDHLDGSDEGCGFH
jgi:hypothetical protein